MMLLKIAVGNVWRSFADYSVYFFALTLAACLLYSFTASGDYLLALNLTDDQRQLYRSASMVTQAFSVFSVVVFAFLIAYANRFILRRRAREFALYELLGMGAGSVGTILCLEGALVGAVSLVAGVLLGIAASPVLGAVAAFVFDAPYRQLLRHTAGLRPHPLPVRSCAHRVSGCSPGLPAFLAHRRCLRRLRVIPVRSLLPARLHRLQAHAAEARGRTLGPRGTAPPAPISDSNPNSRKVVAAG